MNFYHLQYLLVFVVMNNFTNTAILNTFLFYLGCLHSSVSLDGFQESLQHPDADVNQSDVVATIANKPV